MEIIGTIKQMNEPVGYTDKFSAATIILVTEDKYPQELEIQFANEAMKELDKVSVGDVVSIGINIRGNVWVSPKGETKYFTKLTGWKISLASEKTKPMGNIEANFQDDAINHLNNQMEDDLPF